MPAKRDDATLLAEQLTRKLEDERRHGAAAYPTRLRALARTEDGVATDEALTQAAKTRTFTGRALAAIAKDLDSPVAFVEDADQLAQSALLLEHVLEGTCKPEQPTVDVTKLKTKVVKKLQAAWQAGLNQRMAANDWPEGVDFLTIGKKPHLHLRKYPLPRPPEAILAEQLVAALQSRKARGPDAYPVLFSQLLEMAPSPDGKVIKKAQELPAFAERVVYGMKVTAKSKVDSPVALAEDRDLLAGSRLLLEAVLRSCRTDDKQVCTPAELHKKVVAELVEPFRHATEQQRRDGTLPETVGCVLLKKNKPLFFFLADARGKPSTAAPSPRNVPEPNILPAPDFAAVFEAAFRRLEGEGSRGGNFVSLVDLRQALAFPRAEFDRGLQKLREQGNFGLSATDGRFGITPEQQDAGIVENGQLLLYVSRKMA